MAWAPRFFRWHRWLAWLIGLQVLAWIAGGALFSWLPFKPWVKAEEQVAKPALQLPADWAERAAAAVAALSAPSVPSGRPPVVGVHAVATANGPALKLQHAGGTITWLDLQRGGELATPDQAAIARFAQSLYRGEGRLGSVTRLAAVPTRLLIVQEAPARRELWLAHFDDGLGTRLYFDTAGGELITVRNDAWVWYDFFWRLHIMDYAEGEDFNGTLLRVAAAVALLLALTGAVLAVLAARRRWKSRQRARTTAHA
jgi:hypothetical protein